MAATLVNTVYTLLTQVSLRQPVVVDEIPNLRQADSKPTTAHRQDAEIAASEAFIRVMSTATAIDRNGLETARSSSSDQTVEQVISASLKRHGGLSGITDTSANISVWQRARQWNRLPRCIVHPSRFYPGTRTARLRQPAVVVEYRHSADVSPGHTGRGDSATTRARKQSSKFTWEVTSAGGLQVSCVFTS